MIPLTDAWRALDESRHRAQFYRLWRTGALAGFTIPRALTVMGPRDDAPVERARRCLLEGTTQGRSLHREVHERGAPFSPVEQALLTIGEETGHLDDVLQLLTLHFDRRHRWMLGVRRRMAYPLFGVACAIVIAPVSLLVFGHTRAYLATVCAGFVLLWLAGGALVSATAARFGRAPALVRARFARALALGIEAGLPLGRALPLAADASGDAAIASHVARLPEARLATQSLVASLTGCPRMTPELLAVLANAERTGNFTDTLSRLADLYEGVTGATTSRIS